MFSRIKFRPWLIIIPLIFVVTIPSMLSADHPYLTPQAAFITLAPGLPTGSEVIPIINSGDVYHDFTFQGIPDGIGLAPGPTANTVNVFVSHEETTVPFFGSADFQDASVSKLTLETTSGPNFGAVVDASVAISSDDGFLRFCSASMAGPEEGLSQYIYFANEETNDIVDVPYGAPYGPDPALGNQRQGGYAVALNAETGEYTTVPGMGRLNHENSIVVPGGWHKIAILTTDDTFSAPSAQLYMFMTIDESYLFSDRGQLWAFVVTHTQDGKVNPWDPFNGANDYLDIQPGDEWKGRFIRVPMDIARGQTDLPPQEALERWSNEHNVFQFIRLEDLAYDKNNPRVVYVADTGQTRIVPDPNTGRMMRGPGGTQGFADNGRIFKFVFNKEKPQLVDSFSVFADGDAPAAAEYVPFINPDNMGTSANSLMVQEDHDNARVWWYDFGSGTWQVAATVNDPDGESSGIVDASAWFGEGTWLLDVQGHGMYVQEEEIDGVLRKLESGQLMLMRIPGS